MSYVIVLVRVHSEHATADSARRRMEELDIKPDVTAMVVNTAPQPELEKKVPKKRGRK